MTKVGTFYREVYDYLIENFQANIAKEGFEVVYINRKQMVRNEALEVLVSGTLRASELDLMPNLKAIIVPYTGLNNLDINAITQKGIGIFNTSSHAHFVAERAVALVLAVMGRVVYFHNELNKGKWAGRLDDERESWSSIYNKKIGIYGYGKIGCEISRLLSVFRGEIGTLAYKDRQFDGLVMFETLEDLANWCDILIISAPLNDKTKGSVNGRILRSLENKTIINIARGSIIDEDALYRAIVGKKLAGFGSDVWYTYPTHEAPDCAPSKYPFESFDNVVMTPHNAGFEKNSRTVRYNDVYRQILEIIHGDYSSAKY